MLGLFHVVSLVSSLVGSGAQAFGAGASRARVPGIRSRRKPSEAAAVLAKVGARSAGLTADRRALAKEARLLAKEQLVGAASSCRVRKDRVEEQIKVLRAGAKNSCTTYTKAIRARRDETLAALAPPKQKARTSGLHEYDQNAIDERRREGTPEEEAEKRRAHREDDVCGLRKECRYHAGGGNQNLQCGSDKNDLFPFCPSHWMSGTRVRALVQGPVKVNGETLPYAELEGKVASFKEAGTGVRTVVVTIPPKSGRTEGLKRKKKAKHRG